MALSKVRQKNTSAKTQTLIAPKQQEEILMTVEMEAIQFIIDNLTDLYPNPILSSVRETVSNALDATMLMAPEERQSVEVTTPSSLNPSFVVEDHGVGMSYDEVVNLLSKYGASTKKNDFKQLGAYGLGFKSPLSYCSEFHVVTTKDGVTTTFKVSRKTVGNVTTITSVEETGAPSGTKVTIPARLEDVDRFHEALKNYKEFTPDVPLLIDGESFDNADEFFELGEVLLDEETPELSGRIWIKKTVIYSFLTARGTNQFKFLLSGWGYKDPSNRGYGYYNTSDNTIYVELKPGVVDFSSSRDEITLNDRFTTFKERVTTTVNERLEDEDIWQRAFAFLSEQDYYHQLQKTMQVNWHGVSKVEGALHYDTGNNYYGRSPGRKINLEALRASTGFSVFEFAREAKGSEVYGLLDMGNSHNLFISKPFYASTDFNTNFTVNKALSMRELYTNLVELMDKGETEELAEFLAPSPNYYSFANPMTIVLNTSKELLKTLTASKKALQEYKEQTHLYAFAKAGVTDEILAKFKNLGVVFEVVEADELLKGLKEFKAEARKKNKEKLTEKKLYARVVDATSCKTDEEVLEAPRLTTEVTLETILEEPSVVFLNDRSNLSDMVCGLANDLKKTFVGKKIYAFTDLRADEVKRLSALEDFYVDPTVKLRSKILEEVASRYKFTPSSYLTSGLQEASKTELLKSWMGTYEFRSVCSRVEKLIGFLSEAQGDPEYLSDFKKFFTVSETARYAYPKYPGISETVVKEYFSEEEFVTVQALIAFANSNYGTRRSLEKTLFIDLLNGYGTMDDEELKKAVLKSMNKTFEGLKESIASPEEAPATEPSI